MQRMWSRGGREGLASWSKTTWLKYIKKVPAELRMDFISEVVDWYIRVRPLDGEGNAHVGMVRREVEAKNNCPGNTSQATGL